MDGQQPIIALIFIKKGKWIKAQYKGSCVDGVIIYLNSNLSATWIHNSCQQLTAFYNTNLVVQFRSAVKEGTPFELFKFRSLSVFFICRSGRPIAWKLIRKNQNALSSCEAEIMATKKCATELQSHNHFSNDIGIPEAYSCTNIYNENKAAVQWAASVTSKWIKNLHLQEYMVRECHQSKYVDVNNIPGTTNQSDIFLKEMKDNTHFRNIRDSMMVPLQAFLKYIHNVSIHIISTNKLLPYYSICSEHIVPEIIELKIGASEHVVPTILELQSGVRQTI